MLITFLVLLFSSLSFTDTSIRELLQWYNFHPFVFIFTVQDVLLGALVLFRIFNELTVIEKEEQDSNESDFWFYKDDSGTWEKYNEKH